nr:MAG: RNA-dependent RNA polymerase [brine shrimp yue-like virus 8]UNI74193.1 MAG: RNA-dependent RNA polymerase [brine shrimp yue-like virus 8]
MADNLITSDNLMHVILSLYGEEVSLNRAHVNRAKLYLSLKDSLNSLDTTGLISQTLKEVYPVAKSHINDEISLSKSLGKPARLDPPVVLNGNSSVWEIADMFVCDPLYSVIKKSKPCLKMRGKAVSSIDSFLSRSSDIFEIREKMDLKNLYLEDIETMTVLSSASKSLKRLYGLAEKDFRDFVAKKDNVKRNQQLRNLKLRYEEITNENFPIKVRLCVDYVAVEINGKRFSLTVTHFKRVTHFLEQLSYLSFAAREIGIKDSPIEFIRGIISTLRPLYQEDGNFVGEVLKGIKSSLVMRLASDNLISDNQEEDFVDAMERRRAYWVRELKGCFLRMCPTIEDTINLLNIYKIVPHPDINTATAFEGLQGLLTPNQVDSSLLIRFRGTLRKATAESLLSQQKQFRLIATSAEGEHLAELSHQADIKKPEMMSASHIQWASVRFKDPEIPVNMEDILVTPSSKTSLNCGDITKEEIGDSLDWSMKSDKKKPDFLNKMKNTNDAAEALKGSTGLHFNSAINKFKKVIELHERFEREENVEQPEDIDPRKMYNFLLGNPGSYYVIGTEGKFGETHKKTTRMFYIAPENLKTIIQRVERFVKQTYRKAPGVSIVKSYAARRTDLESFTRAMTESFDIDKSIFVSFDMSEFSKKFPMVLIREFGHILSELAGESYKWLERLDLVFRASIVVHNTRGFFDIIGGVKGGFEGFLNFTWSIIHSIIMRIALESTGVSGKLLTFSDDGLLQFYTARNETRESILQKVNAIKRTYSSLGLEFKVTKTIVSGRVWEYLGDVCYKSKLLPCFIKEICSLGKREINRGIELFYDRVKSIQAQTTAFANSGGSNVLSFLLKRYMFSILLEDRFGITDEKLIEWLSITPPTAGGFRIMSPAEASLNSDISQDAEYLADLNSHKIAYSNVMPQLAGMFLRQGGTTANPVRAIMAGSIFHLPEISTTGGGIIKSAISEILANPQVSHKVAEDPLDGELAERLNSILPKMNNVNPVVFRNLVQSTPAWSEFCDTTALLKSTGAVRLIRRVKLKQLQLADTKRCLKAIAHWRLVLSKSDTGQFNPYEMYQVVSNKTYLGISVMPLKLSPREVLTYSESKSDIIVTCQELKYKTPASAPYVEPKIFFPTDVSTGSWMLESKGDKGVKNARKFLIASARAIAYSIDSIEVVVVLAACMGIRVPSHFGGILKSGHRPSNTRSTDVRALLPRLYDAWSTARYTGELAESMKILPRADRRTYLEACRVFASFIWSSSKRTRISSPGMIYRREFKTKFASHERIFATPVQTMKEKFEPSWEVRQMSRLEDNEFRASVAEFSSYDADKSKMEDISRGLSKMSDEDKSWYTAVVTKSLENWLVNKISKRTSNFYSERPPPLILLNPLPILSNALIGSAWRNLEPKLRRAVADYIHSLQDPESENIEVPKIAMDQLKLSFDHGSLLLYMANVPGASIEYFASISESQDQLIGLAEKMCLVYDLIINEPAEEKRPIVMIPHGSLPEHFTKNHKEFYKMAFTNTLSWIFNKFGQKWDPKDRRIISLFGQNTVDDTIDLLIVSRAVLRESKHRGKTKPYNVTAARIEFFKLCACAEWIYNTDRYLNKEQVREKAKKFRLPEADKAFIRQQIKYAKGEVGVDHARLIENGVLDECINRVVNMLHVKETDDGTGQLKGYIKGHRSYQRADPFHRVQPRQWRQRGGRIPAPRSYQQAYRNDPESNPGLRESVMYRVTWEECSSMYTNFYERVVLVAARNIVERSSTVEDLMLEKFVPSSKARIESLNLELTNTGSIYGENLQTDSLDSVSYEALIFLLSSHVKEVVLSCFIPGLTPHRNSKSIVGRITETVSAQDGTSISYYGEGLETDLLAFSFCFDTAEKALHAHSILNNCDFSSVSTFKCKGLFKTPYIVSGARERVGFPTLSSKLPKVNFLCKPPLGIDCSFLIDELTISTQAQLIGKIADMRLELSNKQITDLSSPAYMDHFAMFVNSSGQLNETDPFIQAAYILANESNHPKIVLNSLIAVSLFVCTTQELMTYEVYCIQYNRALGMVCSPEYIKKAIPASRAAHQWLYTSRLMQGITIDDLLVKRVMRFMRNQQYSNVKFATGAMSKIPKKLKDIEKVEGELPEKILLDLEDILFSPFPSLMDSISRFDEPPKIDMSESEAVRLLTGGKFHERRPLLPKKKPQRQSIVPQDASCSYHPQLNDFPGLGTTSKSGTRIQTLPAEKRKGKIKAYQPKRSALVSRGKIALKPTVSAPIKITSDSKTGRGYWEKQKEEIAERCRLFFEKRGDSDIVDPKPEEGDESKLVSWRGFVPDDLEKEYTGIEWSEEFDEPFDVVEIKTNIKRKVLENIDIALVEKQVAPSSSKSVLDHNKEGWETFKKYNTNVYPSESEDSYDEGDHDPG